MSPTPPPQSVFQLRIQLADTSPVVWRRILAPGSVRLPKLHDYLQAAMGWTNSHLHCFMIDGKLYGMHFDDWPEDELDEKEFTIYQAVGDAGRFSYEYDFGDSWTHDVVVEERSFQQLGLKFAVCLDGQNACPPEDVGGVTMFERFKKAIADPTDEEHDQYLLWVGGRYDPEAFRLAAANAALQRVR
ncbi:MAG: plasmid pRiA4b ORF-3 family protein [Acidimicrobiales bacterium]